MDLHHTNGYADWHNTPKNTWNTWQRVAAKTRGTLTPANAVSVFGFLLVVVGIVLLFYSAPWQGVALIIIGRLADICDGWVAHITGTKSPVGETLDATLDKCAIIIMLLALYGLGILPFFATVAVLAIHVGLAAIGVIARMSRVKIHPNRAGKLNGVAIWGALPLYVIAFYMSSPVQWWVHAVATIILGLSILLSLIAAFLYSREIITHKKAEKSTV